MKYGTIMVREPGASSISTYSLSNIVTVKYNKPIFTIYFDNYGAKQFNESYILKGKRHLYNFNKEPAAVDSGMNINGMSN